MPDPPQFNTFKDFYEFVKKFIDKHFLDIHADKSIYLPTLKDKMANRDYGALKEELKISLKEFEEEQ